MTASKHRRMISLSDEADEYLHKHMKERGYRFPGDAIADIIRRYEKLKNNEPDETFLDDATIDAIGQAYLKRASGFYQYLDSELSEVKETTKNTQIDTRVLMELINNLYDYLNIQKFKSTQFDETEATKKAKRIALHQIQEERMQFIKKENGKKQKKWTIYLKINLRDYQSRLRSAFSSSFVEQNRIKKLVLKGFLVKGYFKKGLGN